MDIINILPDSVANQIAAGEVVDRPAGAVKEMLENAMDAGASQIDLVVKDAGRTLIQVVDNGCGMSDSDARLCFERHATSKIHRADDLFAIHTMGFRGEALASIAAIAQVELHTRQSDAELGTSILIEGSVIKSQVPTQCPAGTSIAVKNLFFNVPARRNFLKRDSIELDHIEEVFRRITLIHYDIGFSFVSNGRTLYDLKAGSMLQRISQLYAPSYKERFYPVDEQTDIVRIKGFVGKPEFCRKNRREQYLFVNGRFIKHPVLSSAIEKAYTDLLPDRSYPSYFVSLQVDPSRIDINIHPTKTEVKFVDENTLYSLLRSAVKKALGQYTLAAEFSFDTPPEFNIAPAPKDYVPSQPRERFNPEYNPFRATPSQTRLSLELQQPLPVAPKAASVVLPSAEALPSAAVAPSGSCMQFQGRYIVTALASGLAVIDQQRASERVLFDRLSQAATPQAPQSLLFPVECRFSAADAEMMGELLPDLAPLGFEVAAAGQCTFVVTAAPSDFNPDNLQSFFDQMLADYKGAAMQRNNSRSHTLCASLARQMAIRPGQPLSTGEMQQLIGDLFACPMPQTSPSGKRVIAIVNPETLIG